MDEPVVVVPDDVPAPEEPTAFPMSLHEYAVTTSLDPMLYAALRRWVPQFDRLRVEWDDILARYRTLPIPS